MEYPVESLEEEEFESISPLTTRAYSLSTPKNKQNQPANFQRTYSLSTSDRPTSRGAKNAAQRARSLSGGQRTLRRHGTWASIRRYSVTSRTREPLPSPTPSTEPSIVSRGGWGSRWEFLLSCIGLSVGIGNVWRFPYLAYKNGGGAFLIPYFIMLLLAGKPMYFLELALGQFAGVGPLSIWACCPLAKGIGYAMVTVSLVVCVYYNVVMAYTLYYMGATFRAVLPWTECDPDWANGTSCYVREDKGLNFTHNGSKSASQVYWERKVLDLSPGIEDLGGVRWELILCLLVSWTIVCICLVRGIKTSGKVVYFAATFPYVILVILLITGLCQAGAMSGVKYFIMPTWDRLLDIQVWQSAAGQMFFSLSVSMGALIMYSSYNDFRNDIYRDALVVSVLDTMTSVISGLVIFSVLGAMAHDLGEGTEVKDVVASGPGLAFVAYPEALSRLPVPQLWSFLFFVMLFILGLDSEFALLENVLTSITDELPKLRNHKAALCVVASATCFLLGVPCCTKGGQYILELMDKYGGGTAIIFIAIFESFVLLWVYGLDRICNDIFFMLGRKPSLYWQLTWKYSSPAILSFVLVYSMVRHEPLHYGTYDYPDWADGLGWCLALLSILHIPVWAVIQLWRQESPGCREKFLHSIKPSEEWGPAEEDLHEEYKNGGKALALEIQEPSDTSLENLDNPAFSILS